MKNQPIRQHLFARDPLKPRTRPRVKHTERLKEFANIIQGNALEIQNKEKMYTTNTNPQTAQSSSINTQPTSSRQAGPIKRDRLSEDQLIHYQLSQDQDSQEPDEPPCEQLTENQLIEILDQSSSVNKAVVYK